jgi:hypothetical protein
VKYRPVNMEEHAKLLAAQNSLPPEKR